ncbi:MAG: IS630 family transposase [Burkholderiales bacterium]
MVYAIEFRRAVAKAHEECGSSEQVAEQFGCSESWVRKLTQTQRETGSLEARKQKMPDHQKFLAEDDIQLRELIAATPDMTLGELAAALTTKVSVSTVWRATQRLGLPLKKKSQHAAEQDRPDVKEARRQWYERFREVKLDDLVFLDEFGATTHMTRTRARGPVGQRVVCKVPHGHWKTLSTIAAMSVRGIITAMVFDGATSTEAFVTFVEHELVPVLTKGKVVVLDNLSAHKSPRVTTLIEACGARVIYLPPYSPDFNPIEMAISKTKAVLRKLARRDIEGLQDGIGEALKSITPEDACAYIRHCSYNATNERKML